MKGLLICQMCPSQCFPGTSQVKQVVGLEKFFVAEAVVAVCYFLNMEEEGEGVVT